MDYIVVYGIYKQNHLNGLYKRYDKNNIESRGENEKKNKKKIIIAAAAVVAAVLVFVIVNAVQASNLKKELERDWCRVEGEEGAYILCVLDFSEDEIEYRLETGYAWMDTTVATYDYKVISGNKIKVLRYGDDWETIKVEFSDDKKAMVVSPSLTSTDNEEMWVNID